MFQRAKEREARAHEALMEERRLYQEKFIEEMGDNIREFYLKMKQEKERQLRKGESDARALERIRKHEEMISTEQQVKDQLFQENEGRR